MDGYMNLWRLPVWYHHEEVIRQMCIINPSVYTNGYFTAFLLSDEDVVVLSLAGCTPQWPMSSQGFLGLGMTTPFSEWIREVRDTTWVHDHRVMPIVNEYLGEDNEVL